MSDVISWDEHRQEAERQQTFITLCILVVSEASLGAAVSICCVDFPAIWTVLLTCELV